jgi:ATP-binding cassette subfamily B protein
LSSDVSNLQEVLSITIAEFFRQIFTFIIGFGLVLFISWKLMLWVLFTIPPLVIIAFFFGKKIKKIAKETQQILAKSGIIVEETFTAIAMVKAYTNENFESKRYKIAIKEVMKRAMKSAIFRGSFISFIIVGLFGILVFLAWKATGYVQTVI